ncbi:hypothetical protein D3C78_911190 [compost metagenome]
MNRLAYRYIVVTTFHLKGRSHDGILCRTIVVDQLITCWTVHTKLISTCDQYAK